MLTRWLEAAARWLRGERLAAGAVGLFALLAARIGFASRFQPGQDYHYHVMNAALTALRWKGDAFVVESYRAISPLDSSTFVYTSLFPLELFLSPLDAMRIGFTLLYFVGYPIACAVALRLLRRPMWGALLAFPLAYDWSWAWGGFLPFCSAAPFFVLTIALVHRLLGEASRRIAIAAGVFAVLTFLAHAHVYGWVMGILGVVTLIVIGRDLAVGLLRDPRAAVREAARTGGRVFLAVLPSLLLFVRWYRWTSHEAAAAKAHYDASHETWAQKLKEIPELFIRSRADADSLQLVLLGLVCVVCWTLARGSRNREFPTFELAFVASAAAFMFLPDYVSGQAIAGRHGDMAFWLVPMVVYAGRPKSHVRRAVIAAALFAFTFVRMRLVREQMEGLQEELSGMLDIVPACPKTPPVPELAYVTFGTWSKHWISHSLHQPHESLAAMCRMDTPVYDPTTYPRNLLPVRYKGAPPAPITILTDDQRWYERPAVWVNFEYVLVHDWHPSAAQLEAVRSHAEPVKTSGEWTLWRRVR